MSFYLVLLTQVMRPGLESLYFLLATWLATCPNDLRLDLDLQQNTCDLTCTCDRILVTWLGVICSQMTCYVFFKSRNYVNISRFKSAAKQAQAPALACIHKHDRARRSWCVPNTVRHAHTQLFNQCYNKYCLWSRIECSGTLARTHINYTHKRESSFQQSNLYDLNIA